MRICSVLFISTLFSYVVTVGHGAERLAAESFENLHTGHPRLLLHESTFAEIRARAERDPLLTQMLGRVYRDADAALSRDPIAPGLSASPFLDAARESLRTILSCALSFRLTGKDAHLQRARSEMAALARLPDWDPGHFLGLAEAAFALAVGYDWLHDQLPEEERATLRTALVDRALRFAPSVYAGGGPKDARFWFVQRSSNWNAVCNAGLLAAALALADEEPELARIVVAGAKASLRHSMEEYEPSGSYPEGPVYWSYGTTYAAIALSLFESALGKDSGLAEGTGFQRTGEYYLQITGPTGRVFNYADSTPASGLSPAFTWLAKRFGPAIAKLAARDDLQKQSAQADRYGFYFPLNALWLPEPPASTAVADLARPLDAHLPGLADLAVFRSSWEDSRAMFLGLKAGINGVSHGHLDLGSFIFESDGVRWAVDLGRESYSLPGFFGAQRWSYFRVNNFSHNLLSPPQVLQSPDALAPIVAFHSSPEFAFAVADLSAVYPGHLQRYRRGVALLDRKRVLVQDEFVSVGKVSEIVWHLTTESKITLTEEGRTARLEQNGQTLHVSLLQPADARFSIGSTAPDLKSENPNTGTAMLVIDLCGSLPAQTIAVLLTPAAAFRETSPPPRVTPLSGWPGVPPL